MICGPRVRSLGSILILLFCILISALLQCQGSEIEKRCRGPVWGILDSLVNYPLLHLKQESTHQLLGWRRLLATGGLCAVACVTPGPARSRGQDGIRRVKDLLGKCLQEEQRRNPMLPAAWSSLGPRGGSMTASHLTQVTQAQGREGGQVLWWELGQTFLFACLVPPFVGRTSSATGTMLTH